VRGGAGGSGGANPTIAALYSTRHDFGPIYNRVGAGHITTSAAFAEERDRGQRAIAMGTTSDSYQQRFEASLDMVASDFVVGATVEGQALHLVFAIPARRLAPVEGSNGTAGGGGGGGVVYPLRFRVVVSDMADHLVARLDTLRVFGARQALPGSAYLTGRLTLAVPPGRLRYRFLVTTPDGAAGDLVRQDSIDIPALGGATFTASDLVVGRQGSGLVWLAPRDTVMLNPLGHFPENSAAELYYEVHGLARGAPYHTVVELERDGGRSIFGAIRGLFGGRRAPVLLEFDAIADGPVTHVHRSVDLREIPRGSYRLSLKVTDPATNQTLIRSRRFQVVARS
jgi:hypothetical protein